MGDGFEFYYFATKLKDLLRQGGVVWNVKKDRKESVAEHIFGCLILAYTLKQDKKLDVNLEKVFKMLLFHELEEIFIGDLTPVDNVETKKSEVVKRLEEFLQGFAYKEEIISLTNEFNNLTTLEARFCKAIDKLECVLEFKKYNDLKQVDLSHITSKMLELDRFKKLCENKSYDVADLFFMWHKKDFEEFDIDEKFWFEKLKKINVKGENI